MSCVSSVTTEMSEWEWISAGVWINNIDTCVLGTEWHQQSENSIQNRTAEYLTNNTWKRKKKYISYSLKRKGKGWTENIGQVNVWSESVFRVSSSSRVNIIEVIRCCLVTRVTRSNSAGGEAERWRQIMIYLRTLHLVICHPCHVSTLESWPIRGQHSGHVIALSQSGHLSPLSPARAGTFPHLWQIILIILFLSPRLGAVHQNFWFLWKDHHIIFKRTWHHAAVPMLRHQNWSRR